MVATHKGTAVDAAAHPALGQRGAVPRRRRHRRERLRQPARPGPRHQDRPRRDPGRLPGGRADRGGPACSGCCWRPAGTGSSASGRCRSSGTRCWPTAVPSRCSPRRRKVTWLCHPQAGLGGDLRRPARRQPGRALHGRARNAAGMPARPALPARHDDRRDPLVRPDRHRLAGRRPGRPPGRPGRSPATRPWSGCSPAPGGRGSSSPRAPSSARCRAARSRSATACWCSAPTSRSRSTPPASSGRSTTTAGTTTAQRRGRPLRRRRRRSCWSCASARTAWSTTAVPIQRAAGRGRAALAGLGRPRCSCPPTPATWSPAAR